jgi:hypothetical protein
MADKALRAVGALLLLANGAVHLQRYDERYQHVENISKLFIVDMILAGLLAVYVLFVGSSWSLGIGILFQVGTIVALLYAHSEPFFDFTEPELQGWPAAAIAVELAGAFVLGLALFTSRARVQDHYSRV